MVKTSSVDLSYFLLTNPTPPGILKAIPIVSFWYDHVIRTMVGKVLSATGEAVYTATETASLLVLRSKEIEEARRKLEEQTAYKYTNSITSTTKSEPDNEVMMLQIKHTYSDSE